MLSDFRKAFFLISENLFISDISYLFYNRKILKIKEMFPNMWVTTMLL